MRIHDISMVIAFTLCCRIAEGADAITCRMAKQLGFFDVNKPSQCHKPMPGMDGKTTPAHILAMGAAMCCKSKAVDESVCKADKCVSGAALCLALHNDFGDAEKKLTHPKAMQMNDDGNPAGDCAVAIMNRVEGKLCCTAGMRQMAACVPREVGDYMLCKDSWNKAFEPNYFDKAEAVMAAFQPGGYCISQHTTPITGPSTRSAESTMHVFSTALCAKCGTMRDGKRSCCASDGAWVNTCGNSGDGNFEHTWGEGIEACRAISDTAVRTPAVCTECGTMRNGKRSCCGSGGAWFNKCGNPDDLEFDHTWSEGIEACSTEVASTTMAEPIDSTPRNTVPTLPCEQASDFIGSNFIDAGQTCASVVGWMLPVSPEECDDKPDGSTTKADMLKYVYLSLIHI